jgi:ABC-type ATPase with predicted acetyltransferase domain
VEDARECLHAVGLNSIPIWRLPYYALSNGQKFRADLARSLYDGSVIDEYTSVVDRSVAISASKSLRNHLDRSGVRNIVISTCHRDVLDWLQPDWVIDTDAGDYVLDYTVSRPKWWMEYLKEDKSVGRILLTR